MENAATMLYLRRITLPQNMTLLFMRRCALQLENDNWILVTYAATWKRQRGTCDVASAAFGTFSTVAFLAPLNADRKGFVASRRSRLLNNASYVSPSSCSWVCLNWSVRSLAGGGNQADVTLLCLGASTVCFTSAS